MHKLLTLFTLIAMLTLCGAAQARDGDRDGLPDRWEKRHGTHAKKKSAGKDPDRDTVSNLAEYQSRTDPSRVDSDRDGVRDDDEDRDRDGMDNGNEDRERTNARRRDSDGDGTSDAREDRDRDGLSNGGEDLTGNDPVDRDTDDDGIRDGAEQAGTIASFDGGVLTIALADGTRVAAAVDDATYIDCDSERSQEAGHVSTRRRGRKAVRTSVARDEELDDEADGGDEDYADDEAGDDEAGDDDYAEDDGDADDDDYAEDEGEDDEYDAEDEEDDLRGSDGRPCSSADLRAGVRVHESAITLTEEGAAFEEVELLR